MTTYRCKHCHTAFKTLATAQQHRCPYSPHRDTRKAVDEPTAFFPSMQPIDFTVSSDTTSWPTPEPSSSGGGDFGGGGASGDW